MAIDENASTGSDVIADWIPLSEFNNRRNGSSGGGIGGGSGTRFISTLRHLKQRYLTGSRSGADNVTEDDSSGLLAADCNTTDDDEQTNGEL